MRNQPKPTDTELEILQILWQKGPSSVRDINEVMNEQREVGYTTTLKHMQLMNEKELTHRNTGSRTHIYTANVDEEKVKSGLLNTFIRTAYRGSASSLVIQALGHNNTSREELNEIKKLIKDIENRNSNKPTDL